MTPIDPPMPAPLPARLPEPSSERGAWILVSTLAAVGLSVLVAVLAGLIGTSTPGEQQPLSGLAARTTPAGLLAAPADLPAPAFNRTAGGSAQAIVARPSRLAQRLEARRLTLAPERTLATRWIEGFYPIYAAAQRTFGVNWLLLASIHMQESAFSSAPSTYHGLNFARCCGGPMQFNVTNRPVSTWARVRDSYRYATRPAVYNHMTATHPSIYDDFDAVMAAAHLLSADGAEYGLDGAAWSAAYDYYGHDATGVAYADQVLARAIGWAEHGFCFNCGVPAALVQALGATYGAPVLAALSAPRPRASLARVGAHAR